MARTSHRLALAAALIVHAFPCASAGAQTPDREAAPAAFAAVADAPSAAPRETGPEAVFTLREALMLALRNNLDVQLARSGPRLAGEALAQARGAFDPVASFGSDYGHEERSGSARGPSARGELEQRAQIKGSLPLGLRYSSSYSVMSEQSHSGGAAGAEHGRRFESELTLPLLRDLRMNEPRAGVLHGELEERAARAELSSRLSQLVADIETLYWELAAAQAELRVAARSLQSARALREQTRAQEELGLVARVRVSETDAGVAERELDAIRAENTAARARDRLLSAVLAPDAEAYTDREFTPEVPTFERHSVNVEQATANALRSRPDLYAARRRLEQAELAQDLARNQLRPRLDLSANYSAQEASSAARDDRRGSDDREEALALQSSPDRTSRGFSLRARFELPLGNRGARAAAEQRAIELRRARTELARLQQTAILEVRSAVGELESAEKAVHAAERRRAAATVVLQGEQERVAQGEATPLELLQADEQVVEAERQLIGALRDHRNASTRVEQTQGRLLSTRGVMEDAAGEP